MGNKAGKRFKGTIEMSIRVRKLYHSGKTREEISKELNKSLPQINRYFLMGGKITPQEKALHMQNRYLK